MTLATAAQKTDEMDSLTTLVDACLSRADCIQRIVSGGGSEPGMAPKQPADAATICDSLGDLMGGTETLLHRLDDIKEQLSKINYTLKH
jgi:hypothetical protein